LLDNSEALFKGKVEDSPFSSQKFTVSLEPFQALIAFEELARARRDSGFGGPHFQQPLNWGQPLGPKLVGAYLTVDQDCG